MKLERENGEWVNGERERGGGGEGGGGEEEEEEEEEEDEEEEEEEEGRESRLTKVETRKLPGRHKFPPSSHLWLWHSKPVFENFHNSLNATPFQFHVSIFLMKMFFHPGRHKSFTGKENQAEKAVPLSQYAICL